MDYAKANSQLIVVRPEGAALSKPMRPIKLRMGTPTRRVLRALLLPWVRSPTLSVSPSGTALTGHLSSVQKDFLLNSRFFRPTFVWYDEGGQGFLKEIYSLSELECSYEG